MTIKGNGFVIDDDKETLNSDMRAGEDEVRNKRNPPLPEVNFNSLVFSLSSSALFHMGEIADPKTGEKTKDVSLAKHSIDIISMLKDKTSGNLTGEEEKFLHNVLTDLRLRYVKAANQ